MRVTDYKLIGSETEAVHPGGSAETSVHGMGIALY